MNGVLLAFEESKVDVSAHLTIATNVELTAIALVAAFFLVRPELWRRLWFDAIDPRPAALMRIAFGAVVLATFVTLLVPQGPLEYSTARYLFTDDGLWLTDTARKNYNGEFSRMWDPVHGFEHWYDPLVVLWGKFTPLHMRSDPTFAFGLFWLMCACLVLMILGVQTRITTIASFVLVEWMYRYSPVFYTGADTVVRVFLFLGMFARWGEAYSIDTWWRRKRAILRGGRTGREEIPPLRTIPAWPLRLMMLQLACIYCATGLLKSGDTWMNGTALYYALNLDHFYRYPTTQLVTVLHFFGVLPVLTIVVHFWECLFPLALIGAAVNGYERERADGLWPRVALWRRIVSYVLFAAAWCLGSYIVGLGAHYFLPPQAVPWIPRQSFIPVFTGATIAVAAMSVSLYHGLRRFAPRVFTFVRKWVLGKRFWLTIGVGMHTGIMIGVNVGTFAQVMIAVYFAWLSGEEVNALWRYAYSRAARPGEGTRPVRTGRFTRLLVPYDRLRHRVPGRTFVVHHHPGDASVRRAALLRLWDLGGRLSFIENDDVPPEVLRVRIEGGRRMLSGDRAAAALTVVLPGLLWLRPFRSLPGAGRLARAILRQRA